MKNAVLVFDYDSLNIGLSSLVKDGHDPAVESVIAFDFVDGIAQVGRAVREID